jgi:hypothetical protein
MYARAGEEAALLAEWQTWLAELRAMDKVGEDQGVQWAIEEAERTIAETRVCYGYCRLHVVLQREG